MVSSSSMYLIEFFEGVHRMQMVQRRKKEMSSHTAGITHATRHRSLCSSVVLKWISNVIQPSDRATAMVREFANFRYISSFAVILLACKNQINHRIH